MRHPQATGASVILRPRSACIKPPAAVAKFAEFLLLLLLVSGQHMPLRMHLLYDLAVMHLLKSALLACRAVKARGAAATGAATASADGDGASPGTPQHAQHEYLMHPAFPELPEGAPLTYTLTMHACLSISPNDRPTFDQVRPPATHACMRLAVDNIKCHQLTRGTAPE